ncbi:terminase large subunit [Gluconacetobacter diazotrophicus]|uniref:terminase large subunit n=1 Tax=Gluconacetobacter diazotrophicus TaxID=33996 RepID=UPI001198F68B|nr:terminase large subunit [Gluconacetobacter diazotrophicus]TWB09339.1 phage terminase large subunit-like protein [Gluconacetobacter diazotrophicus]
MIDYNSIYESLNDLEKQQYEYAKRVLDGDVVACKWVKLACLRSFSDYEKQRTDDFPYYYDSSVGEKFRKFCLCLTHVQGRKGGTPVVLDAWQVWLFSQLLGWKHDRGENQGYRRFRTFHLEVGRGNGKSFIMSILAIWGLACDGDTGPEIYSAATDKRQASIIFDATKAQVKNEHHAKLIKRLGLQALRAEIRCLKNNGKYCALSRDSSRMDGLNISMAFVDELHAHPNRNTWDVLASGAKKRPQSLMAAITTAGVDVSSFGYQQNEYVRRVLEPDNGIDDESFLCVIYCAEEDDDFYNEDAFRKANPCWDSAIDKVSFIASAQKAKLVTSERREFFTKNLNMWVAGGTSWIDGGALEKCRDFSIREDDEYDFRLCGIDLAYVNDLCCYVNVFGKMIDGYRHYYIFPHAYIPQRAIDENFNVSYPIWRDKGQLNVMEGEAINQNEFGNIILNNSINYNVSMNCADAWQATAVMQQLASGGASVRAIRQTTRDLSAATAEFEVAILEGRLHFNNDLFRWNCLNAVLYIDNQDLFKPVKEHPKSSKKIDTVAATINAIAYGLEADFGGIGPMIY